jgi:hypothetical protein
MTTVVDGVFGVVAGTDAVVAALERLYGKRKDPGRVEARPGSR